MAGVAGAAGCVEGRCHRPAFPHFHINAPLPQAFATQPRLPTVSPGPSEILILWMYHVLMLSLWRAADHG